MSTSLVFETIVLQEPEKRKGRKNAAKKPVIQDTTTGPTRHKVRARNRTSQGIRIAQSIVVVACISLKELEPRSLSSELQLKEIEICNNTCYRNKSGVIIYEEMSDSAGSC